MPRLNLAYLSAIVNFGGCAELVSAPQCLSCIVYLPQTAHFLIFFISGASLLHGASKRRLAFFVQE